MNITRLTPEQVLTLAERLTFADLHGVSVRISTGVDARGHFLMWDIGNTGWTPPFYGDQSGADCSNPDCAYIEHGVSASNRRQSEFYAKHPRDEGASWSMLCGHFDSYKDPNHDCSKWSDD